MISYLTDPKYSIDIQIELMETKIPHVHRVMMLFAAGVYTYATDPGGTNGVRRL